MNIVFNVKLKWSFSSQKLPNITQPHYLTSTVTILLHGGKLNWTSGQSVMKLNWSSPRWHPIFRSTGHLCRILWLEWCSFVRVLMEAWRSASELIQIEWNDPAGSYQFQTTLGHYPPCAAANEACPACEWDQSSRVFAKRSALVITRVG